VGAGSRSGKHGNIDQITGRAGYGGVFTLKGREHARVVTAAKSRGGQQEAEGSEGQASRMRRALPDKGIHLYSYIDSVFTKVVIVDYIVDYIPTIFRNTITRKK